MTVFMTPRTNYVLGRYGEHSVMAWIVILFLLIGGGFAAYSLTESGGKDKGVSREATSVVLGMGALGLFSRNGRRCTRRLVGETFFGSLHTFTGVCSCNSDDIVGPGGPAKEI